MMHVGVKWAVSMVLASAGSMVFAQVESSSTVYKCPGRPVLYTSSNSISAKEARDRGCTTIEGAPITVISSQRPRVAPASGSGSSTPATPRSPEAARIDPNDQKARDKDARRILEQELRTEEEALSALRREYNNGEPERRGDERNYQKYLDRVAEMKANLARKESDVAAIKRELAKLP